MKNIFVVAIITLFLSACSGTPKSVSNDAGFMALLKSSSEKIEKNPNYRRIPIDTKEQRDHFLTLYHQAYQKKITKEEFIQKMNAKYPGYSKSIQWNADQLPD